MNLDVKKEVYDEIADSIKNGDTEGFVNKINTAVYNSVYENVMKEVRANGGVSDEAVLAKRGFPMLTSEEKDFYENLKKINARDELTGSEITLPLTISNRVYEDMFQKHELLSAVDFVDSKGKTRWIFSKDLDYAAAWGDLNDAVSQEADAAFAQVEFGNFKLSAYIPVPKTMLELGLTWLDQFVVRYLSEIIARALEKAIVQGDGQKQPVGMTKQVNIESQSRPASDKSADPLTELSPTSVGAIAAKLTNNGVREVGIIDLIVNPVDYWTKIYPAIHVLNANGAIVSENMPLRIIQSSAVPTNKAIFGICANYFATVGFGAPNGKIEYSDHYKFLEDVRTYKARCVAYGTPKDNVSFFVYDITNLGEATIPVKVKGTVETSVKGTVTTKAEGAGA